MSDWIPFDIQLEIIKKVSNVKSLIRFRSVSKPWKSCIDSSKFIKGYNATQPHSCTFLDLRCKEEYGRIFVDEAKYICFDDNYETFKGVTSAVVSPLLKQCSFKEVVGECHGLLCLYGSYLDKEQMIVIWNPSIQKSFGIVVPYDALSSYSKFGFGVCPVTSDLIVVRLVVFFSRCHVEVFTSSSGVWTALPDSNAPHCQLHTSTSVVIDRFIFMGASFGISTRTHVLLTFNLSTKEFRVLYLPDSLTNELGAHRVSVCKLRESLVVYGGIRGTLGCGVWVMEHDSSFTKLFTIGADVLQILGFRKSGEPIYKAIKDLGEGTTRIDVYDPCSQQIKNLEIGGGYGEYGSLFTDSYKESLLLLDHSDSRIYNYIG